MAWKEVRKRREFLVAGAMTGTAIAAGMTRALAAESDAAAAKKAEGKEEVEVSPTEDLMREHGLLNRILLIYDESMRRMRQNEELDPKVLAAAAKIVRSFVEDYHEKLEEDHLFPRFEKANKLVDLVKVLRQQHQAGRRLTDEILRLATPAAMADKEDRQKLGRTLRLFNRMYRPHEAREDTVLFPALHFLVTPKEFEALGDQFEEKEQQLFGKEGFEKMVDQVAGLEKQLGIDDLARFTPGT